MDCLVTCVCMYMHVSMYVVTFLNNVERYGFSDNEFLGWMKGRLPGSSQEDDCYRR